MKKLSWTVLIGSVALTAIFLLIWIGGFLLGQTLGGLIHIFLLLAFVTGFGVLIGAVLLIISLVQKK